MIVVDLFYFKYTGSYEQIFLLAFLPDILET
jgi:hypothetical protein